MESKNGSKVKRRIEFGAKTSEELLPKIDKARANVSDEQIARYKSPATRATAKSELVSKIDNSNTIGFNGEKELAVINRESGDVASITKRTMREMTSDENVRWSARNGFTKEQHYAAAADADVLFENAIKVGTHPDRFGSEDLLALNRYASPTYDDGLAYITERVTTNGDRVYSLELINIGGLGDKIANINARFKSALTPTPPNH